MLTSYQLMPPRLNWGADGAPHSRQFDDLYFDKTSGLAETQYVFLEHNNLIERWKALDQQAFVIAETGFGTGLNFLCAWQAFIDHAAKDKQLHFISVEKYPLSKAMLAAALRMWPTLSHLSEALIEAYPQICHGFHRIELEQGRIQLTLWFGDAQEGFRALNADVDAWFLDGFAPSKNPDMWTDQVFKHIRRLSHTGSTFSTFTAAGIVRRGLKNVGFDVRKVKGFGQKREMAIGQLKQVSAPLSERMAQGQAWFNLRAETPLPAHRVLVVGSGLAAANTAYALAKQGIKVTVWEQGEHIACAASGNPQGMLYPKLASQDTPVNRFYLAAYLYATRLYNQLDPAQRFWQQCGLIQMPKNAKEAERFQTLLAADLYPKTILQASTEKPGSLLLPLSGWVVPTELCATLLSHTLIQVHLNTRLEALSPIHTDDLPSKVSAWKARTGDNEHIFSHVVLCTANDTKNLASVADTPAYPIRGQVSFVDIHSAMKADEKKTELADKLAITRVLCELGYVSPALDGLLHFGATYDLKDDDTSIRAESHRRNLAILESLLDLPAGHFSSEECGGRVSFRCAVPDYTPIVGPVQSDMAYRQAYSALSKNAKWQSNTLAEPINHLYFNIGHGSRGLVSTPLSGAYIASLISHTPSPLEHTISHTLHPSRFIIRDLKRNQSA